MDAYSCQNLLDCALKEVTFLLYKYHIWHMYQLHVNKIDETTKNPGQVLLAASQPP